MSKQVDFYYDFASPNAYFSAVQMKGVRQRTGAAIVWKPILLGGIFKELGTTAPVQQSGQKAAYLPKDLQRWGKKYGIPFRFPSIFPMNTVKALRGAIAVERIAKEKLEDYIARVFAAYWVEDRDINADPVLSEVVEAMGIDREKFFALINDQEIKDTLRTCTDEAVKRGVFGTPSFFVGEEMFWGKDRIDFVEDALKAS